MLAAAGCATLGGQPRRPLSCRAHSLCWPTSVRCIVHSRRGIAVLCVRARARAHTHTHTHASRAQRVARAPRAHDSDTVVRALCRCLRTTHGLLLAHSAHTQAHACAQHTRAHTDATYTHGACSRRIAPAPCDCDTLSAHLSAHTLSTTTLETHVGASSDTPRHTLHTQLTVVCRPRVGWHLERCTLRFVLQLVSHHTCINHFSVRHVARHIFVASHEALWGLCRDTS